MRRLGNVSIAASSATLPGTVATCSASWPSDIDFGCGFQDRCACGIRSSTRARGLGFLFEFGKQSVDHCHVGSSYFAAVRFGGLADARVQRRPPVASAGDGLRGTARRACA